ncbi:Uncharacterised protein [Vibrio cholerae]|nr:Uncharacterised protein [Vibrio cholerae]
MQVGKCVCPNYHKETDQRGSSMLGVRKDDVANENASALRCAVLFSKALRVPPVLH